MLKPSFLLTIIMVGSVLVGCIPATQPVEAETFQEITSLAEETLAPESPANPYLNCLSPVLKMNVPRAAHTATLLPDGRVLIAGGFREEVTSEVAIADAELFDPTTKTFVPTGSMNEPRDGHTATLLPNGQVLIVGGWNQSGRSSTAELYDPLTEKFEYTASLMAPRQGMTATLLNNGQVLIAGGDSARSTPQMTAELYDPATKRFIASGSLDHGRMAHSATLLKDGKVLLVGGSPGNGDVLASAEIYDPQTGTFSPTSDASMVRYKHSAVLLQDGNVLILGGSNQEDWSGKYDSAEVYNSRTGIFMGISDMNRKRFKLADAAILLPDGNVLIGGGNRQLEIFDVQDQEFILSDSLDNDYYSSVLTLLDTEHVLITGGYDANIQPSDKAWLYCG
ncbi:MAG TPA: kelch repeat-containing protein [Anaerolineales bacterium]|nr:kelch repeat-containing protein [Anaerolineales bacterium]